MDYMELSDQQRSFFGANGYLIVPEALCSETVAEVTAAADEIMDNYQYEGYY